MLRIIAGCASLLLCPLSAYAGQAYTSSGVISDYNPREWGLDVLIPGGGNPMPCGMAGYFRLKLDAVNYQVISAFLLSQFAQQKPVQVFVNGCTSDGLSIVVAARAG